jgi:hypothetical protein
MFLIRLVYWRMKCPYNDKVVSLYVTGPRDGPAVEETGTRVHGSREVDSCEIAPSHFHCVGVSPVYMTIPAPAEI